MRLAFIAILSMLFFAAATVAKPAPVYLDSLPVSKKIHLLFRVDSLTNCDTDSRVKRIIQDTIPLKKRGDDAYFPDLKADSLPVQRMTYLNRSGDSLFFMAAVQQDSVEHFFTSVCIDRRDVIRFSVEGNDAPDENSEKKPSSHRGMGGGHRGMGGGGMR